MSSELDLHQVKEKVKSHDDVITIFKWLFGLHLTLVIASIPVVWNIQTNLAVLANTVSKIDTTTPQWLIDRLVKVEEQVNKNTEKILEIRSFK